jgi:hypothetical protein
VKFLLSLSVVLIHVTAGMSAWEILASILKIVTRTRVLHRSRPFATVSFCW